ncbi:MAG TPA: cyclase family protein [bacterium]|nr:cyclase family protein [bacterium]HPG44126.1 cyclase family protein [bacterium]HPM96493.1 cyclase family protein [bacterium]
MKPIFLTPPQIIDLTHPIHFGMPHWPGDPQTRLTLVSTREAEGYLLHRLEIGEHSGTHLGAPIHMASDGASVEQIAPDRLFCQAFCLDCRPFCQDNSDFLLSAEQIIAWEAQNSKIDHGALVLILTGWSAFWHLPERYLGHLSAGQGAFPGIGVGAAEYLVQERRVSGLGIDSAGIDGGKDQAFSVNRYLAEHDVFHLENLAALHRLPACGAWIFIGALPLCQGSGSPCRVLALLPSPEQDRIHHPLT